MYFIGDRIRYLKECNELKQKVLAREFGVAENTWSQYETNNRLPDIYVIKKISEFFKVSVEYLLATTDIKYDPNEESFKKLMEVYSKLDKTQKELLVKLVKSKFS